MMAPLMLASAAWAQNPVISSFTPTVGAPADTLLVEGSGFSTGNIKVYFWNGVAGGVTVRSDLLMDVVVPSAAGNGPLAVQRDNGPVTYTAANFTRIGTGPFISDVSPTFGSVNDMVTISGVHFLGVNGVKFNGAAASDASVNADGTTISVRVPNGATSGLINVTTPAGSSNSPAAFTVIGAGPFVTGFSPDFGSAGTTVLIDGVHFTQATGATFNGVAGVNFSASDTLIRVDAPPGVTTGPIGVSYSGTNWTTVSNFYVSPAITNFSPANGRALTNVTIKGVNFRGATGVSFNNVSAAYTVVDNNTIVATAPGGVATGILRVSTPNFSGFSSSNFVVKPTISGFLPPAGPAGTAVTIMGANLNVGTPVVRFNGVQAAAPTGISFGQLTAVVPAATTTGRISVTTADGSDTNAGNFYLPAAITGFTPTNSAPGTTVTITGVNFLGASQVSFNGTASPALVVNSNTSISATVPAGITTGPITVITPAGFVTSSGLFYGAPLISGFSPAKGLPGTSVTITGNNFLGASAVRFNGLAGSISSVANGQIVAVVPDGAQTGPVSVQAPAGTAVTATNFVVDYNSDLEVWMTNTASTVTVGSNVVFSTTMQNHGPFNASNARWTNAFPASFVIDSVTVGSPWSYTIQGSSVVATTASAASGGNSTMVVSCRPQAVGTFVVSSSVYSDNPDPSMLRNSVALTTRVDPLPLLNIRWWTNQVRVSWPLALSNFVLEANSSAGTTNGWGAVTNELTSTGAQWFIIDTNGGAGKFYRLKN